jgi:hypothetical protein
LSITGASVLAESPNKSSPHGSAAFHGGVLRIAQKGFYVRTAIEREFLVFSLARFFSLFALLRLLLRLIMTLD